MLSSRAPVNERRRGDWRAYRTRSSPTRDPTRWHQSSRRGRYQTNQTSAANSISNVRYEMGRPYGSYSQVIPQRPKLCTAYKLKTLESTLQIRIPHPCESRHRHLCPVRYECHGRPYPKGLLIDTYKDAHEVFHRDARK